MDDGKAYSWINLDKPTSFFTATPTQTVMPTMGERPDRRRGRGEGGERVAAVGRKRACFDRRSFCRAPQQGERSDSNCSLLGQAATLNPMVESVNKNGFCETAEAILRYDLRLLASLFNSNSHGNGHTDHGVVTNAQEAYHLNVGGDGGGTHPGRYRWRTAVLYGSALPQPLHRR